MKHFFICILIILTAIQLSYSQSFTPVDFEAGGYVTEIYTGSMFNEFYLYARTDIGGVYSSRTQFPPDWSDWTFLNTFATSPAGLHVQGFLTLYGQPHIICCGTDYLNKDLNRGLWKKNWLTLEWEQKLDINYGGNVFHSKIGGECIVKDYNFVFYTGGRYDKEDIQYRRSEIHRSTDLGETWVDINPTPTGDFVKGNVSTIVINPSKVDHIWVGTDEGIWRGEKQPDNSFVWYNKKPGQPPEDGYFKLPMLPKRRIDNESPDAHYNTPVHRIIMKSDASMIFITQGEEIFRSDDYGENWLNLTEYFDGETPTGDWGHVISAVNLFDDETKLLVSRIEWPTKISYGYGDEGTWSEEIDCTVDQASLPKHKCSDWDIHISYSRTNFTFGEWESWYSSGPFNLYQSKTSDFLTTEWEFMDVDKVNYTHGINFPVVYDVTFGKGDNPYVYVPIADLIQARFYKEDIPLDRRIHIEDYAREKYEQSQCDEYMSNATRILVSEAAHQRVYMIGGDLYHDYHGSILRSDDQGEGFYKTNPLGINLNEAEHCIIDGLVSDLNADKILVLVGGGEGYYRVVDEEDERGVYWSDDGGYEFERSTGISPEAWVDELFTHQTNLAKDPNNDMIKFLYLEGDDIQLNVGGFFKSMDCGHSWNRNSLNNFPDLLYLNKGCLSATDDNGTTTLYLAMWGDGVDNGGLFKSIDKGSNWDRLEEWTSSQQVIAQGNLLYVFGKKVGESFNKIYRSTDGGNTFPTEITNNDYHLPSTSHLTIDPDNSNVLWVSTSGQGVYRIDIDGDKLTDNLKINTTPYDYSLEQNYPNPFNPVTQIKFSIPTQGLVTLKIYDVTGREVAKLVNDVLTPGNYVREFNGENFASGVYFYRIIAGEFTQVKKMVLIK